MTQTSIVELLTQARQALEVAQENWPEKAPEAIAAVEELAGGYSKMEDFEQARKWRDVAEELSARAGFGKPTPEERKLRQAVEGIEREIERRRKSGE